MAVFRMEQRLPSALVSRELVKSLEAVILKQIEISDAEEKEKLRKSIKVAITDDLGTETFTSIDEMGPSKFPDKTKSVNVSFSAPWRAAIYDLHIDIDFRSYRHSSAFVISCNRSDAREYAHGIAKSILERIHPHELRNGWLHPGPGWGAVASGCIGGLIIPTVVSLINKSYDYALIGIVAMFALFAYVIVLPQLRPYTEFESRACEQRKKWSDWFLMGTLSFIFFGTIFALVKDHIFRVLGVHP